jgi:1-acyl-sn-glycerol-3-phosphate acyltransferase
LSHLSRQLAALSATEMVAALGAATAPKLVRQGLALPFYAASRTLGQTLAGLDDAIATHGLPGAAALTLERFGVRLQTSGVGRSEGPRLVLANHPGAYDALALMSALGREDLRILAADRSFLRALPRLSSHLLFVADRPIERAGALKRAVRHLRAGGALLHFPAGKIEPDADFAPEGAPLLEPWQPGVAALVAACARFDGRVAVAGVRGVHSPRAKGWLLNRVAEGRGITTLSPLLQMVGGLRDVVTRVCCFDADSARQLGELTVSEQQAVLRAALERAIRGSLS